MLKGIDKKESYTGLPSTGGRKLSLPKGISHKQSHYFQTLAENKDVIEQVKKEAKENDDLPTRTEVLRIVKDNNKKEQRKTEIVEMPKGQ